MSFDDCRDIQAALPLIGDAPGTERLQAHLVTCGACEELHAAFEADGAALAAMRANQGNEPALDGFTDAVMARLEQDRGAEEREHEAPILTATFGPQLWLLAAAALLLAVGLVFSNRTSAPSPDALPVASKTDVAPADDLAPVPVADRLPAPRSLTNDSGFRPRRSRSDIRPVGDRTGRGRLMDVLQNIWPQRRRRMRRRRPLRLPDLKQGEREVSF